MSHAEDLDDQPDGRLRQELRDRAELRGRGVCDYCHGDPSAKPCKWPRRHVASRKLPAEERMSALAESFPALRNAPGVRPWRALDLEEWTAVCSSGELHAARFVLQVWNVHHEWSCGPFQVVKAMCTWDDGNRAAFQAWAEGPWTA